MASQAFAHSQASVVEQRENTAERRSLYPRVKSGLQFFNIGGGLCHVYDPSTSRHFKFGEQEVGWLKLLDGQRGACLRAGPRGL